MRPPTPLTATVSVLMLSTAMFGWTNGNMNTPAVVVRESLGIPADRAFPEREVTWAWCVSVYCVGALFGCLTSAPGADVMGRRAFLLITSCLFVLGAGLQTAAICGGPDGVRWTIIGRLVVGVASGSTTVLVPAYLSEIAPDEIRGALGVGFQLVVTISMLVAQVVGMPAALGTPALWPAVMALAGFPAVPQLLLASRVVESPRWLAHVGRRKEAEAASLLLAGKAQGASYAELESPDAAPVAEPERPQAGPAPTVRSIFETPELRGPFILIVATLVTQQLSGINNAFNYSTIYLEQNGVDPKSGAAVTVAMNLINVAATVAAAWLCDRAGRKLLLVASAFAMALFAALITAGMAHLDQPWGTSLALTSIVLFVASFGLGLGPIPWLLAGELFPQSHRATAQGAAALCNWAANGFVATAFPPLAHRLGAYSFLPFAAVLVAFGVFAAVRMPETRNASLDELEAEIAAARAAAARATGTDDAADDSGAEQPRDDVRYSDAADSETMDTRVAPG